ncbi:hypothetical protein LSAT2_001948 [Lamellibrachia satsuma]|nr:hypothetical protein LSAT2_001948 [Lamellibrachia satsuma]
MDRYCNETTADFIEARIHLLEDDWFGIGVVRLGSTGKPLLGIGIDVVRLGSTGKPRLASGLEWIQRLGDDRFRIGVVRMRSSTNDEAEEETTQDVCRDEQRSRENLVGEWTTVMRRIEAVY